MSATSSVSLADGRPPRVSGDVGLICQLIRLSALAWIGWSLYLIVAFWGDRAEVVRVHSTLMKLDLSALPASQHAIAFALVLADWVVAGLIVWFVWRLFGHYLRGDIFTRASVEEMRRLGWAGVVSVAMDLLTRALMPFVLTMHIADASPAHRMWANPNDLLHLMMAVFILALARIFKSGVEIAEDHRQIV